MNKYQEALCIVKGYYVVTKRNMESDEIKTLQKLVDKETPMKTILNRIDEKTSDYLLNECPNCEYEIDGLGDIKYCPMCGQKLLFVEFEELMSDEISRY